MSYKSIKILQIGGFLNIFFIFFVILICTTCKEKCEEYYLGSLVTMNPYSGTEKLVFSVTGKDEITFLGLGRNRHMNTVGPLESGDVCESVEFDDCFFESENSLFKFWIFLRPTVNSQQARMILVLKDYRYNESRGFHYSFDFSMPLDKNSLTEGQTYYDSLNVFEEMYYEVFSSPVSIYKSMIPNPTKLDTIKPTQLFYNIHHGLLKLEFDDESFWELKEIREINN